MADELPPEKPKRRRSIKHRERLAGELAAFKRRTGRKSGGCQHTSGGSGDPNDRHIGRGLNKLARGLDPEELDALMNGDLDD